MLGYFAVLFIVTINVIIETNNEYMHAGALFVRNLTNETYVIHHSPYIVDFRSAEWLPYELWSVANTDTRYAPNI